MPDLRNIMREALTQQKQDNDDRARRAKNIIIYGIKELATDINLRQTEATTTAFVNELSDFLESHMEHTQYTLGRKSDDNVSQRPIKVIVNSIDDKNNMMLSLKKLRDAPEHLKAARICDDSSPDERSLVCEKVDEARLLTGNKVDPN